MEKEVSKLFYKENIELEYLIFADANTLKSIAEINPKNYIAVCIAAYIDGVRLIDNIIF